MSYLATRKAFLQVLTSQLSTAAIALLLMTPAMVLVQAMSMMMALMI